MRATMHTISVTRGPLDDTILEEGLIEYVHDYADRGVILDDLRYPDTTTIQFIITGPRAVVTELLGDFRDLVGSARVRHTTPRSDR